MQPSDKKSNTTSKNKISTDKSTITKVVIPSNILLKHVKSVIKQILNKQNKLHSHNKSSSRQPSFRSSATQYLAAQSVIQPYSHHFQNFLYPRINHIYNEVTGKKETIDTLLQGKNGDVWLRGLSNEFGRLA